MPAPNPAAMDFLLSRRSPPAKTLSTPVPDRAALMQILTAAARVPDHARLEPWRFVVLERAALDRIAAFIADRATELGMDEGKIEKGRGRFAGSPLCVAVIEVPREARKFPQIEQTYSAGAACLSLLNAALASGWGANWLSGWYAHDAKVVEHALGLAPHERVVGFVHIGTESSAPPERPRPDLDSIVTWVSE